MDKPSPPHKPAELLNDLESIRELLGDADLEPPLLVDSLDPDAIPLLSDIVTPPASQASVPQPAVAVSDPAAQAVGAALRSTLEQSLRRDNSAELRRLDGELRAAAVLILNDLIDEYAPRIEAELKRRLEARLSRLLPPRKP